MSARPWEPVSTKLRVHQVIPTQLLVYNDRRAVVVQLQRSDRDRLEAWVKDERHPARIRTTLAAGDRLEVLARQVVGSKARILRLPPVLWDEDPQGTAPRNLTSGGAGVLVAAGLVAFVPALGPFLGLLGGLLTGLSVRKLWPKGERRTGVGFLGHPGLGLGDVHDVALAIERGAPPPSKDGTATDPDARVAVVRQAYGRLRSDLVYRIEHPALFDPKEPTTAAFEQSLAAFATADGLARHRRAGEVEVAFNVARQNAERRGLRHVEPEHRPTVRRAAKAARLAERATTQGERAASLDRVRDMLDAVALYYLPSSTDEALALEPPR